MVEVLLKSSEIIKGRSIDDISNQLTDFNVMQLIDYSPKEILWLEEKYGIDFSIMKHYEDIEISSHFLIGDNQVSFHISIPYYNTERNLEEEPVFFIISAKGLFFFSSSRIDSVFHKNYSYRISQLRKTRSKDTVFKYYVEFIADHYADITEYETKKVKTLASMVLLKKEFSNQVMDLITRYNFNNLLIKESLIETTRVFNLYKKSSWGQPAEIKETITDELNDLSVVSDYVQFNFDRLEDLKENVSNKIDLEQNYIFKMLTVVTVCISLPTLIAGIYGMNFKNMPELSTSYGYPLAMLAMILSGILPFMYFKRKKWL